MRKKVGIVKRLFTLLLIFLLSINSFAAIVSDNDGSAFITKAEFDALKSSFQAQIDSYNQSIDSKIDGAIASYLSGINLATNIQLDCLLNLYGGGDIVWGWNSYWDSCIAPHAGWATYYLNATQSNGYLCAPGGAQHSGIKNPAASSWTMSGKGDAVYGYFFECKDSSGHLMLDKFLCESVLQNCSMAGWYGMVVNPMELQNPWGNIDVAVRVGESTNPTYTYDVDCGIHVVRKHEKYPDEDLRLWSSPWAMSTNPLIYTLDQSIAGKTLPQVTLTTERMLSGSVAIRNCYGYLKDWSTSTANYSDLYYGYAPSGHPQPKIYGGLPLCKVEKPGSFELKNLKFSAITGLTSSYVYFAISDGPFGNNNSLVGSNIPFDSTSAEVTVHDATNHVYKVATNTNISSIKFKLDTGVFTDRYLYIKVAPQMAKPATTTKPGTKVYTKISSLPTIIETIE